MKRTIYDIYSKNAKAVEDYLSLTSFVEDIGNYGAALDKLELMKNCAGYESISENILSMEYKVRGFGLNIKKGYPDKKSFIREIEKDHPIINIKGGLKMFDKDLRESAKRSITLNYNRSDKDYDSLEIPNDEMKKIKMFISNVDKKLKSVGWGIVRKRDLDNIDIMENESNRSGRFRRVLKNIALSKIPLILMVLKAGTASKAFETNLLREFLFGGGETAFSKIRRTIVTWKRTKRFIWGDIDPDFRAAVSNKLGDVVVFGTTKDHNKRAVISRGEVGSKLYVLIKSNDPDDKGKYGINAVMIASFY